MNKLIQYFAQQGLFANLLTIVILVVGVFSATHIQRETFPNISFDLVQVLTTYPGASAQEMEKLITNPLEQDFKEIDGIKKIMSTSLESRSIIILQIEPGEVTDTEVKSDAQDIVERWEELPDDAEKPIVTVLNSKQRPVIEVSLSGDIKEERIRAMAKLLESELENLKDVAKVNFSGLRDIEVFVEALPEKLDQFHLSLNDLIFSLKTQNLTIPGGQIEPADPSDREIMIRTVGDFSTLEDIQNTVIRSNDLGVPILIKDVAKVSRGFEKPTILQRANGTASITLTVIRKESGDMIRLVDQVKNKVSEIQQEKDLWDKDVIVDYINDASYFVRRRLNVLSNNLGIGLILVLIVLTIFLPWRVAFVTSFGIPFSFLGALVIFYYAGISLNLVSMMGLIIVVGMLVDDAVVVTENATRLMQKGMDPVKAAIQGTQQMWKPVLASVATTMMAFIPLMSMSGVMGKFVKYIPLGVIISLAISLYECFFILPHHVGHWMSKSKNKDGEEKAEDEANDLALDPLDTRQASSSTHSTKSWSVIELFWNNKVVPFYLKSLERCLDFRYLVLLGGVLLIGLTGYVVKNHMKVVIFPKGQIELFMINLQTARGTSLQQTLDFVKPVEKLVAQISPDEMEDYITKVGIQGKQSMNDPSVRRGHEYAQIFVYLTPSIDRDRTASNIIEELREKMPATSPNGIVKYQFVRPSGGPPVGLPINIGVRGKSYEEINKAVAIIETFLNKVPGVSDVENTYILGKEELHVKISGAEAKAAGLDIASIGQTVRAAYEGIVATSIRQLDDDIDIRVSLPKENKFSSESLFKLKIPNKFGNLIPLTQVAHIQPAKGMSIYEHENNRRQVRVLGDLDNSIISSQEIADKVKQDLLPSLSQQFPRLKVFFGGENEDTAESMASLKRAFLFSVFGIFLILVLTFKNVYQPLLVLVTIPLGLISTVWTFFIHGQPFSFLGMIGAVALGGVIVNNAIVFMEFVNQKRLNGYNNRKSLLEAGKERIRPIFLTTVTTGCGVLPTAYGIGGLDQFVVPIALALGWGIFVGSFLTTMVFPVALAIFDDIVDLTRRASTSLVKNRS